MLRFLFGFAGRLLTPLIVCTRALLNQTALGALAVVTDEEGRVLLARARLAGGWTLPGGGVGAFEPPERAVLRELKEEVGLLDSAPPELIGLYTRRILWATNVIALYRVRGARLAFKPNLEISGICWTDPADPPQRTQAGVARRLAEITGQAPRGLYW